VKKALGGTSSTATTPTEGSTAKKPAAPKLRRTVSTPATVLSSTQHTLPCGSLDIIASRSHAVQHSRDGKARRVMSERCGVLTAPTQHRSRAATPDRDREHALELWRRMPASPEQPLLSPGTEYAQLHLLDRSPLVRTLEWACARDRMRMSRRPSSPATTCEDSSSEGSQSTIDEEVIRTPETSFSATAILAPFKTTAFTAPIAAPTPAVANPSDEASAANILLLLSGRG
jgi:hypothetical protein